MKNLLIINGLKESNDFSSYGNYCGKLYGCAGTGGRWRRAAGTGQWLIHCIGGGSNAEVIVPKQVRVGTHA